MNIKNFNILKNLVIYNENKKEMKKQDKDAEINKIFENVSENERRTYRRLAKHYIYNKLINRLMYRLTDKDEYRIQVLEGEILETFNKIHSNPSGGHFGENATAKRMSQTYYWKNMLRDIKQCVKECPKCQKTLSIKEKQPLSPIISEFFMERLVIDLVGPLKKQNITINIY